MMYTRLLKSSGGLVLSIVVLGTACAEGVSDANTGEQALPVTASAMVTDRTGTSNDSLTYHGITLYGTVDIGGAYQLHGVGSNSHLQTGLEYPISKNSNQSITSMGNSGLSQSVIGIKGDIALIDGLSGIFKLEPGINPLTLNFTNSSQSLVDNNGRSLNNQNANGDTNRAGRIDNGDAYIGINSTNYGTLIFGRQTGVLADNMIKYDPNGGSYAFSLVGYYGSIGGGGDGEDVRLDSSLKYTNQFGWLRMSALYQPSGTQHELLSPSGVSGSTVQLALGGDYGNFSGDFIYAHKNDGIAAAALTATQMLTLSANSLAATVSDNAVYAVMGKYTAGSVKVFGGYERIRFSNPSSLLSPGITDIGGYTLSALTQNAYNTNKILQVYWTGMTYSMTPKLDLTGAYYGWNQNSYSGNGCSDSSSPKCSGNLDVLSFVAVYKLMKHVDAYAGTEWSGVHNGSASGYLYTHNLTTMVGVRLKF